jgi:hypothetical protein
MALPVLDATFASAADLPRRQMLAKWLVLEKGETQSPFGVLVSGAGSSEINGTYTETGEDNGKKYYNFLGSVSDVSAISWTGSQWAIWNLGASEEYVSDDDVEFPWQVTTWTENDGSIPLPTVTEAPFLNPIANYYDLPERYLWAKIAVAAGASRPEADYVSLPKNYAWSDIYNAVASASGSHTDWTEKQALGHIAAAYRGDTANPEALATYIDWPWRYQVASIVTYPRIDADALAYIQRVEIADGASLESGVRLAIDNFVRGCKTDGIWDAIKASTILAGARTLSGALQPLVGVAPTNFNFVSGDYNRKTGLVGNGTSKYLNSNRDGNVDPTDNCHGAVYATTALSVSAGAYFGARDTVSGSNRNAVLVSRSGGASTLNFSARSGFNVGRLATDVGLIGVFRNNGTSESARSGNASIQFTVNSAVPGPNKITVFAQNAFGTVNNWVDARLAFYSIGESLDLALLDTRVTNLINAYAAAIP